MEENTAAVFPDVLGRSRFWLFGAVLLVALVYAEIIAGMVGQWYEDPNYGHGFLIPLISGYFIWQRREALRQAHVRPSWFGLPVILASLLLLIVAHAGTENFTMRASLILLLAGMTLFFFGREVFRLLAFPLGFLILMVPIPYILYDAVAFPLKLFVAKYSVFFLKMIGVIVLREGNIIMFPNAVFEVADACSGIRSLISLIALSTTAAFLTQKSAARRAVLIASAIPVAIFVNGIRVVGTGILAQYWGAAAAEGFFHEFAGMAVFIVAIVMIFGLSVLLRKMGTRHDKEV